MNNEPRPAAVTNHAGPFQTVWHAVRLLALTGLLAGCASVATYHLSNSVTAGMVNQDDPETVADGMPAYLLLLDGTLQQRPEDTELLLAAARLNGAYASVFAHDKARAARIADKALNYARKAFCLENSSLCEPNLDFQHFKKRLGSLEEDDLPVLYGYATAWAGSIQNHSDNWLSVADLPRVQAMLERVVSIDENYEYGQAHVYLGVMNSQLPPALGGHPEVGRAHFERAIELSGGRNLVAYVEYARSYARLMFDRELHDRLLNTVLKADTHVRDLTLSNVIAQREAEKLLSESKEYFGE